MLPSYCSCATVVLRSRGVPCAREQHRNGERKLICARSCWYPVARQLHLGFAKARAYTILYNNVPRHVGCPLCVPWPSEARAHRWGYGTGVIPAFTNTAFRPLGRMALQLGRDLILLAQSNKQDHGVAYRIAEPKRIKASDRKKVGHSLCRAVPQSG